jgi:hypothetical protein
MVNPRYRWRYNWNTQGSRCPHFCLFFIIILIIIIIILHLVVHYCCCLIIFGKQMYFPYVISWLMEILRHYDIYTCPHFCTLSVYYYYKCGPCGSPGGIEIEHSVTAVVHNSHPIWKVCLFDVTGTQNRQYFF